VFTRSRVEHVEPADAVVAAMIHSQESRNQAQTAGDVEELDADVCVQMPLFASAEAAQGGLDAHPGGLVLPIRQAWDLSLFRDLRDRMSALLNLDH
jgi:hypothetical protein